MGAMTGAELKEIRETKGISLERAAEATCLRAGFLREMEEVDDYEAIPEVYRKLSFRMYARFLGVEMETTRKAVRSESRRSRISLVPMTNFVRRMGRPPKPPVLDRQQRNRLLTVAKTTSAAVVVVLAIGLYSLNAKLARLNIDEKVEEVAARHVAPEPRPQLTLFSAQSPLEPHIVLEEQYPLVLVPGTAVPETPVASK
jgi:cytoskeletal protein RodZ